MIKGNPLVFPSSLDLEGNLAIIAVDASSNAVEAGKILHSYCVRRVSCTGPVEWVTYGLLKPGITCQVSIDSIVLGAFDRPPLSGFPRNQGQHSQVSQHP